MFVVIEMQTNGDSTAVLPVVTRETQDEADSVWHTILASAAISNVEKHAAIVVNEEGVVFRQQCYYHGTEPSE